MLYCLYSDKRKNKIVIYQPHNKYENIDEVTLFWLAYWTYPKMRRTINVLSKIRWSIHHAPANAKRHIKMAYISIANKVFGMYEPEISGKLNIDLFDED